MHTHQPHTHTTAHAHAHRDIKKYLEVSNAVQAGTVWVNCTSLPPRHKDVRAADTRVCRQKTHNRLQRTGRGAAVRRVEGVRHRARAGRGGPPQLPGAQVRLRLARGVTHAHEPSNRRSPVALHHASVCRVCRVSCAHRVWLNRFVGGMLLTAAPGWRSWPFPGAGGRSGSCACRPTRRPY